MLFRSETEDLDWCFTIIDALPKGNISKKGSAGKLANYVQEELRREIQRIRKETGQITSIADTDQRERVRRILDYGARTFPEK